MYEFKAKYSEFVDYLVCLRNILKDFLVGDMKQTELNEYVYGFWLVLEVLMLIIFLIFKSNN